MIMAMDPCSLQTMTVPRSRTLNPTLSSLLLPRPLDVADQKREMLHDESTKTMMMTRTKSLKRSSREVRMVNRSPRRRRPRQRTVPLPLRNKSHGRTRRGTDSNESVSKRPRGSNGNGGARRESFAGQSTAPRSNRIGYRNYLRNTVGNKLPLSFLLFSPPIPLE